MRAHCHRCHGELPERAAQDRDRDEDALLFCPRCGAPQILLPEHMRVEEAAPRTTGATPPPRPDGRFAGAGLVDWRAALPVLGLVAGVGAVLALIGLRSAAVSLLSTLWTIGGAVIALGLYARHRPRAWMDARVGLRLGVATGLLMIAAIAMALSVTGVVVRYGMHGMAQFDQASAQSRKDMQARVLAWLDQQNQDKDLQQKYVTIFNSPRMNSPEMQAGSALFGSAVEGFFIVLLSAGGGAFAGRLRATQAPRPGLRRGD